MELKRWMQVILAASSILTLAACSTGHKKNAWAVNDTNNANYSDDAQASGLGDDSNYDDQDNATTSKHVAAKNVYYFDFDSDVVHQNDRPAIEASADRLTSKTSAQVMLEGHTDPRGSREYNIGLGERRAKSVAEVMTTKGANPRQIRIVSYGAEKLASNGRNESDYQKDRRVVLQNTQS